MRHIFRVDSAFQRLHEDVRDLNDSYCLVGSKLKGVGELFEQQNNNIVILADQGSKLEKRMEKAEGNLRKVEKVPAKLEELQQLQQGFQEKTDFNLDIFQKTMQRNNQTLTE